MNFFQRKTWRKRLSSSVMVKYYLKLHGIKCIFKVYLNLDNLSNWDEVFVKWVFGLQKCSCVLSMEDPLTDLHLHPNPILEA